MSHPTPTFLCFRPSHNSSPLTLPNSLFIAHKQGVDPSCAFNFLPTCNWTAKQGILCLKRKKKYTCTFQKVQRVFDHPYVCFTRKRAPFEWHCPVQEAAGQTDNRRFPSFYFLSWCVTDQLGWQTQVHCVHLEVKYENLFFLFLFFFFLSGFVQSTQHVPFYLFSVLCKHRYRSRVSQSVLFLTEIPSGLCWKRCDIRI